MLLYRIPVQQLFNSALPDLEYTSMRRTKIFIPFLGLVLAFGTVSGCSKSPYEGEQRFPLTGTVTLDGEPVDGGTISFIPSVETKRVTGGPIAGGKYTVHENSGANAGEYRVEIHWLKPTGEQFLDKDDTGEMIDVVAEAIPQKYNTSTELVAEVSASQTEFDFSLTSK